LSSRITSDIDIARGHPPKITFGENALDPLSNDGAGKTLFWCRNTNLEIGS